MKLPRTTWHVWLTWLLLLAVSLFMIAVALTHDRWQSSSAPTPPQLVSYYMPPPTIYGITVSTGTVPNPWLREQNLCLCKEVANTDHIMPYGYRVRVHLPGPHYLTYRMLWVGYLAGIQCGVTFLLPNGGRELFLHMNPVVSPSGATLCSGPIISPTAPQVPPPPPPLGAPEPEHPPLQMPPGPPKASGMIFHGGDYIGLSGWPTDPAYGKGIAGRANAHLCTDYDALGADWLYRMATRQYPPKPKNPVHWQKFGKHPHKSHGRLTWPARVWLHNQKLGAFTGSTWTHRKGHLGFSTYRFEHGHATCWPQRHHCRVRLAGGST
jgi:hypothetical protein